MLALGKAGFSSRETQASHPQYFSTSTKNIHAKSHSQALSILELDLGTCLCPLSRREKPIWSTAWEAGKDTDSGYHEAP